MSDALIEVGESHRCDCCGKIIPSLVLDESADGIEGYIARNMPKPDKVFCSNVCFERGKIN